MVAWICENLTASSVARRCSMEGSIEFVWINESKGDGKPSYRVIAIDRKIDSENNSRLGGGRNLNNLRNGMMLNEFTYAV